MKKKIWIPILVVVILAILFVPIPSGAYKDGGTREYTALTYKIVDWNRLTDGGGIYEKTKVYFRVSNVYRDVKITVKAGDRVLLEKKKQKVAPGEMETVILTPDMLSSCDKDETHV